MEQPEIKITEVPTGSLVPYANNAKLHGQLQVEQIANSIEEFGFNDPIAVWENKKGELEVVEGHGRVLAAQRLGIDTVPVFYLNHLSDEQRRAYAHVHNQTTLNSGFSVEMLDVDIKQLDFDWESFGFDLEDKSASGGTFDKNGYHQKLTERYVQNPFSVLDASSSGWMERKKEWNRLIGDDKVRGDACLFGGGLLFDGRS